MKKKILKNKGNDNYNNIIIWYTYIICICGLCKYQLSAGLRKKKNDIIYIIAYMWTLKVARIYYFLFKENVWKYKKYKILVHI